MSIIGKRFGRLVVLEKTTEHNKSGRLLYLCKCDCGKDHKVPSYYLTSRDTKSCGCLALENLIKRSTKHGFKKSIPHKKVYNTWALLRDRCNNKNNSYYSYYGGKGIKVCERWDDFTLFLADMGMPPEDGKRYSIDRIDSNKDYCPENCRWATDTQQANNRTNNRYIEQDGVKYTVADFARKNNISESLVRSRVHEGKTTIAQFLAPKGYDFEKEIDYKGMVLFVYPNAYCKATKGRESIWVGDKVIARTSSEFSAWRLAHKRIKAQCL